MAIMTDYDVDRYEKQGPTFFQQLDWIPAVSTVTGVVRVIFGLMEMAIGILTLIPELVYTLVSGKEHIYLIARGGLDVLRGLVANVWILGNVALYMHDTSKR
ncbi:MAG TPA: hypothetical protein PKW79_05780 [Rhabdochlamydiaceae bacterium]|nr:hypothetical protein [Rhabdochlamydiaceae bacterium]